MYLEVITPDKNVYKGEVTSVTLPGAKSPFQVLNDHASTVSALEEGKLLIQEGKEVKVLEVVGGVVEVLNNKVIVLAEGIKA
ncbi:MAG: ATP synthase F1 subunit epsilon [Cytophagales bacterium]|nr:ATP synthase F1 subunit epsilon [Cytophagales bacterium]